ncbi:unnamed protein product [Pleuronectes platessa]|uniref:Uncharacterized protein n=1 Tax=Pleuronectes platessa TaxID=8262 RepID=A0A9N7VMD4_PLEPL|nr:unnamed protein product [Pleuronectes platessa]
MMGSDSGLSDAGAAQRSVKPQLEASRGRRKEHGGIGVDVVELCEAGGPTGDYQVQITQSNEMHRQLLVARDQYDWFPFASPGGPPASHSSTTSTPIPPCSFLLPRLAEQLGLHTSLGSPCVLTDHCHFPSSSL